jgi:hypothetical protein
MSALFLWRAGMAIEFAFAELPTNREKKHSVRLRSVLLLLAGFAGGILATNTIAWSRQRATIPDAVIASPDHYKVEFENEFVRVIRVKLGPHEKAVMHQHPGPGAVIVRLTDQDARLTAPDGTSRELHYKTGSAMWSVSTPGADLTTQSAHAEENLSDKPFEQIRIEPKQSR